MTDRTDSPHSRALQELEDAWEAHRRAACEHALEADPTPAVASAATESPASSKARSRWARLRAGPGRMRLALGGVGWGTAGLTARRALRRAHGILRKPWARRVGYGFGAFAAVLVLSCAVLWWRLSSGPISLDLATPFLTSALEENLGSRYRIAVGGTQLERDKDGHTALRLRDVVVRDASGRSVAVAPKAEVGIAGTSLLLARPRAKSLRLVDAQMRVLIEADGRINIYAGGEQPFTSISAEQALPSVKPGGAFSLQSMSERSIAANFAALIAWVDGLGERRGEGEDPAGFDGKALTEVGILNGAITIDDRREDKVWTLNQIGLKLLRPSGGGLSATMGSDREHNPWMLHAALTPGRYGVRQLRVEARKVLLDDLLALRMSSPGALQFDTHISASIQAEIAADGTPQLLTGNVVAEGGTVGDPKDPKSAIPVGAAEFALDWEAARGTLRVPFKINAGATRAALRAEFAAPRGERSNWAFAVGGGWILVDPPTPEEEQLVLRRVVMRGQIDPDKQQVVFEQADFGTKELGGSSTAQDVSLAVSGRFDYGGDNPRMTMGLAGNPMPVASFKRLWPVFVAPTVREWVMDHMVSGTVERIDIAVDAPTASLRDDGPSIPPDGLFVDLVTSNTTMRPVHGLPAIRNADLVGKITGSTATITMARGLVDVSPGRRLTITNGVFEVPDARLDHPTARVRLRVEGTVPAAAELLTLERLRDFASTPFDPATSRGNVAAQIALELPLQAELPRGSTKYDLGVDLTNFSADKMMNGHRVEAQSLRVTATNQGYQIRGDVRINNVPALLEYRKAAAEPEAELFLAATLDESSRNRLGLDFGPGLSGGVPLKMAGRVGLDDVSRFNVEADLTPVRIEQLLPGWVKAPGRPARATFMVTKDKNGVRFDDVTIDGSGMLARGTVELDPKNELRTADFPVFATSDGDKAALKAERIADGALRVTMRGDVYDGRSFVKSTMSGTGSDPKIKPKLMDIELDVKIGAVVGHHGETLRALELRLARRGGRIRTFNMSAKIGRDTPLIGDIRTRVSTNRPILYFETNDAGSLFRFTDVYPRMVGGQIWVVMDPPTQERTPQEGLVNLRDFAIRGEGALDRVVSGQQNGQANAIDFSLARAEFTKTTGRLQVRDGLVRGPMIGGTIEGNIDYARNQVNMRGTLVPLYGINNMFGQIPIVGLFLGGGRDEGLLGITYEVTGPPGNPRPMINPLSAIAPGLLRKFFEFRDSGGGDARSYADPSR